MNKFKLVLPIFVFAFIFISFIGFNADSASAANCAAGDLFNSTTGQHCSASSTNTASTASTTLTIGSRGNAVKALQQSLKEEGYYLGKIDGVYGKRTARSVKEFQDDNDLPVTGIADTSTLNTLNVAPVNAPAELKTADNTKTTTPLSDTVLRANNTSPFFLGDANTDGLVNTGDVLVIMRHAQNIQLLTGQGLDNADVNGDGVVTSVDGTLIANWSACLILNFPRGASTATRVCTPPSVSGGGGSGGGPGATN